MKALQFVILGITLSMPTTAWARINVPEVVKKTAETQVRNMIEPLIEKYCRDECRLMAIQISVDTAVEDQIAPGFDEIERVATQQDYSPSGGRMKLLINDRMGPVSRTKLLELLQQFLDTLDYPVKIETQVAHFPAPAGSESKIASLRERVSKQFRSTVDELIGQFCPQQCLVADFNVQTDVVNAEEAQFGAPGEFVQDGDTALKIRDISATLLVDESLSPEERANVLEMAKLKTNFFKNVTLQAKAMKFPRPTRFGTETEYAGDGTGTGNGKAKRGIASTNEVKETKEANSQATNSTTNEVKNQSQTQVQENNTRQEKFERIEKIERVESGDAVQAELKKFQFYAMIFGCSVLSLLIFILLSGIRGKSSGAGGVTKIIQSLASDPTSASAPHNPNAFLAPAAPDKADRNASLSKRYEIESLIDELNTVYATAPRVAKQVFSRILTEEGVETTAQYMSIFGESVVVDMLRDPSLQSDMAELMEFYAKNPIELSDDDKLDLLRKLHARTVAGKLAVIGNRSSNLFDFLSEMDGSQILELIRTESLTVKSIVLTQVDPQKRATIYAQLDQDTRLKLLTELSRIDYLPRDYIFNVANALKRKRRDNPRLNTEALPGSEVLVTLLERTGQDLQKTVIKHLDATNPDSSRTVKSKLVSIETLRYLRDGQLLEVILSLKHDELLQFLKGAAQDVKSAIFSKSPKELVVELEEELQNVQLSSREGYQALERKVLNRMKTMANEGLVNLVEVNERMFSENTGAIDQTGNVDLSKANTQSGAAIKKVAGW